jgi:hypothetical protein
VVLVGAVIDGALAVVAPPVTVLAVGWLLGGTVGIGTLIYAAGIGPLAHVFVPLFSRTAPAGLDHDLIHERPHDSQSVVPAAGR